MNYISETTYAKTTHDDVFGIMVVDGRLSEFRAAQVIYPRKSMLENANMMTRMSFKFAFSKMALQEEYQQFIDETLKLISNDPILDELLELVALATNSETA